jgi:TonB-linked SusC/RagA family outer membrane protein
MKIGLLFIKNCFKVKQFQLLIFLLFISIIDVYSQGKILTGKVLDENQNPFPGVYITIKGTTNGTSTNAQGEFTIKGINSSDVLVFSFLGYIQQEVAAGNKTSVNITLKPEIIGLDEVVAIGYGTKKKSDLTGAVTHIKASEIQETPIVNLADALKGRAAGVVVSSNSGAPGSSPSILIRGMSSIQAGNQPLLIVDGMPSDLGMLNQINMNDVESFEVLKDASSTAIYGSAGANGVILLNTKRGKAGKTKIDFNIKYGTRHFPEFRKVLNSKQFYNYLKEINITTDAFSDSYFANYDSVSLSTIDTTNMVDVDWQDEMFDVGNFQEYSLSFSGGKENLAYVVSGSYLKDIGIISPAEFERYTFLANIDNKISNRIKLSGNAYFSHIKRVKVTESGLGWNGGMVNSALQFPPFVPIIDNATGHHFPNPIRPQVDSPKALANGSRNRGFSDNLRGNLVFSAEIIKNLTFRTELLASVAFSRSKALLTDITLTTEGFTTEWEATTHPIVLTGSCKLFLIITKQLANIRFKDLLVLSTTKLMANHLPCRLSISLPIIWFCYNKPIHNNRCAMGLTIFESSPILPAPFINMTISTFYRAISGLMDLQFSVLQTDGHIFQHYPWPGRFLKRISLMQSGLNC